MDADIHMIQNEKIDEISKVINEDFERLLEMKKNNRKTHSKSIEKIKRKKVTIDFFAYLNI